MKFLESHFEDYLKSSDRLNLHKSKKLSTQLQNTIMFGPPGIGKYTQALRYVRTWSPTGLKYERKLNIALEKPKKGDYTIKMSDIHFEIDMNLLGCNAKTLWNTIYFQILDIISTRSNHFGIIICKNFHTIHSELLDIFYSYMQTLEHKNIKVSYVLITEHVSFIPLNIIERCKIFSFRRPSKVQYSKCIGKNIGKFPLSSINNIKDLHTENERLQKVHKTICDLLIEQMTNVKDIKFLNFRELLYGFFIYHLDICESIWYIISHFIKKKMLTRENTELIFLKLFVFLRYFNNNYRSIYHLENFMLYVCKIIHGFEDVQTINKIIRNSPNIQQTGTQKGLLQESNIVSS